MTRVRYRRLGWWIGGVGALLVLAAILVWQGLPARNAAPQEPALAATPTAAISTGATPTAMASPTPIAVSTPTPPAESRLAAAAQVSPLSQPDSPLTTTLLLLPTVVVEERLDAVPTATPDAPVEPDEPEEPEPPSGAPVYGVRVVNTFPHDPAAFTQGLEYRDGVLYEGTGIRGQSSLRRVELETGQVLQQVDLDAQYFGEGITVFEDRIFQLTWQSRTGFVYARDTFELLDTVVYATEGWGLTHDGERLIMSDGSATITYRDPATFEALDTIQVRDGVDLIVRLNELEYIEGEIWANIWLTDRIARIDPATGHVLAWLDLRDLLDPAEQVSADAVLNGIAYDAANQRIFVTGKLWPYLFEIEVLN